VDNKANNIQELIKRVAKKYFFLYSAILIFLAFSLFWYSYSKTRKTIKNDKIIAQGNIKVIAWDLHDVLFYKKPPFLKELWGYEKKSKLFPNGKIVKLILKDFKRVITGKDRRLNSTLTIKKAIESKQQALADFLINHESNCKPKKDMFEVIKKLDAFGYKQYICSNISSYGLARLVEKYPDFFSYFAGTYTTLENNGLKPQKRFFKQFLETYTLDPKTILFIDDKKENCRGAEKLGMYTLCFKGEKKKDRQKSVRELYRILKINDNQNIIASSPVQQGIS